jgi:hypothetical protein
MSAASAAVTPGYSAWIARTARTPSMTWATMKEGTDAGESQRKVAKNIRPMVMAGLAKPVEDVRKYAAPI